MAQRKQKTEKKIKIKYNKLKKEKCHSKLGICTHMNQNKNIIFFHLSLSYKHCFQGGREFEI